MLGGGEKTVHYYELALEQVVGAPQRSWADLATAAALAPSATVDAINALYPVLDCVYPWRSVPSGTGSANGCEQICEGARPPDSGCFAGNAGSPTVSAAISRIWAKLLAAYGFDLSGAAAWSAEVAARSRLARASGNQNVTIDFRPGALESPAAVGGPDPKPGRPHGDLILREMGIRKLGALRITKGLPKLSAALRARQIGHKSTHALNGCRCAPAWELELPPVPLELLLHQSLALGLINTSIGEWALYTFDERASGAAMVMVEHQQSAVPPDSLPGSRRLSLGEVKTGWTSSNMLAIATTGRALSKPKNARENGAVDAEQTRMIEAINRTFYSKMMQFTEDTVWRVLRGVVASADRQMIRWLGRRCDVNTFWSLSSRATVPVSTIRGFAARCLINQGVLVQAIEKHAISGHQRRPGRAAWTGVFINAYILSHVA